MGDLVCKTIAPDETCKFDDLVVDAAKVQISVSVPCKLTMADKTEDLRPNVMVERTIKSPVTFKNLSQSGGTIEIRPLPETKPLNDNPATDA